MTNDLLIASPVPSDRPDPRPTRQALSPSGPTGRRQCARDSSAGSSRRVYCGRARLHGGFDDGEMLQTAPDHRHFPCYNDCTVHQTSWLNCHKCRCSLLVAGGGRSLPAAENSPTPATPSAPAAPDGLQQADLLGAAAGAVPRPRGQQGGTSRLHRVAVSHAISVNSVIAPVKDSAG